MADQSARTDIETLLDETLFVSAGAGSGKTTALVGRLLALVGHGIALGNIAAITFTEKAASELRDRLRNELSKAASCEDTAPEQRERCRVAIDEIDGAALSTLHSFAQRLLSEHPIEAGLPPGVEVVDEIGSDIDFDDRWRQFIDQLLEDSALEASLLIARHAGVGHDHLRDIAKAFGQNWDLVAERVPVEGPAPALGGVDEVVAEFRKLGDFIDYCNDETDKLLIEIEQRVELADGIAAINDRVEAFGLLFDASEPKKFTKTGRKSSWTEPSASIDVVREAVVESDASRYQWCSEVLEASLYQLASAIAVFTTDEADRRRRDGRLEFHDLLVLARKLLRDPDHGAAVRVAARDRYQRILLDEFQDTDPIQIELAVLLGTAPASGDQIKPWFELNPEPGRLFFVGDPKQSIYRFRRADISLYLRAAERFGQPVRSLTTNFRSTPGVLSWINHVFGQVIRPEPGSQPAYEPLVAGHTNRRVGASVTLLGVKAAPQGTKAPDLRHLEAAEVVTAIRTVVAEQWEVADADDRAASRPARLGDICILLPARTSLPQLERALEKANVPFRAEASSLLYASAEVRDLMAVLRAIDDPTDEVSLVTALRSAAMGCGDDDLYDFKVKYGGQWSHQAPIPDEVPKRHPVREAMEWLNAVHEARTWLSPSELIDRVFRDRSLFEVAFGQGRFRDVWRRYRFVLDQARAYGDAVGGALRDYLIWVSRQAAEGSRVSETVLPETDDEAVRILTVHASKGLEFPITILSGMTTAMTGRRGGVRVVFPPDSDDFGLSVKKGVTTEEFETHKPLDEQMSHNERLRLLYVACTRAEDHLIVSCHRVAPRQLKDGSMSTKAPDRMTAAELLFEASKGAEWVPLEGSVDAGPTAGAQTGSVPIPALADWQAERTDALSSAQRPRVTSATAIARASARQSSLVPDDPGVAKEPRDLDLPPWRRGRYGTAIGRAVHGVLQAIDLATGAAITHMSQAQAAAEGVDDKAAIVEELAASALSSPVVAEAAAAVHWKEVYVAAPVDGVLLEGYVDLIFERGDGLVLVDYKTDYIGSDGDLEAKLDRYRLQLGAYVVAVEAATGRHVVDAVFVFCDPDGSREAPIANLAEVALAAGAMVDQARSLGPVELG